MLGYIKIGDIAGDGTVKGHEEWIAITNVTNGANRNAADANDPIGALNNSRVQVGGVQFRKEIDKSTPELFKAVCNGTVFPEVTVHCLKGTGGEGEKPFMKYTLSNAFIQSYDASLDSVGGGNVTTTELVSLGFEKIRQSFVVTDATGAEVGSIDAGWNLATSEEA